MDYRKMVKSQWFTAAELDGQEMLLTITKVTVETVKNQSGEEQCPTIHFAEHDKPLVLNKTNAKSIAAKHGTDADQWSGKQITLKESVTSFGGEEVPCVRIK